MRSRGDMLQGMTLMTAYTPYEYNIPPSVSSTRHTSVAALGLTGFVGCSYRKVTCSHMHAPCLELNLNSGKVTE
ncbi:unnamed protein product [Caretta caretta]